MRGLDYTHVLLSFVVALASACGAAEEPTPRAAEPAQARSEPQIPPTTPAARVADAGKEAREIFDMRCVTCHGARGAGDGPGSASLTPAPRNFQDAEWQTSVSDEHLQQIIQYGGAAVGRSAAMPGNPDLSAKPEVVAALVALIRGLGSE